MRLRACGGVRPHEPIDLHTPHGEDFGGRKRLPAAPCVQEVSANLEFVFTLLSYSTTKFTSLEQALSDVMRVRSAIV